MTSRPLAVGLLSIVLASCSPAGSGGAISLISLIATPERYVDSRVIVSGFHETGHEPPILYLSREQARVDDWTSGVLLYETVDGRRFSSLDGCHDRYVKVVGRFAELPIGGLGVTEIERVVAFDNDGADSRVCFETSSSQEGRE